MFSSDLKVRVQSRLDFLGINAFEADRRGGLKRGYVNDILNGRKKSVRGEGLALLAVALECDETYLTGHQGAPRIETGDEAQGMPVTLTCEADTWRPQRAGAIAAIAIPVLPDPRYPNATHVAALIRGDSADQVGLCDGAFAVGVNFEQWQARGNKLSDGLLCIVKRFRAQFDEVEYSIRRVRAGENGVALIAPSARHYRDLALGEGQGETVEIVAVVICGLTVFA